MNGRHYNGVSLVLLGWASIDNQAASLLYNTVLNFVVLLNMLDAQERYLGLIAC